MSMRRVLTAVFATAAVLASVPAQAQQVGLFNACYQVGTGLAGAPTLHLNLAVSTPTHKVSGVGQITQAVNPPKDIHSDIDGVYSEMTVMPNTTHIQLRLAGTQPGTSSTNLETVLVLSKDWKSGEGEFSYRDGGNWVTIPKATAKLVPCSAAQ